MKRFLTRFFAVLFSVCVALSAFSVPSYAVAAWVVAGIEKVFEQIVVGWFASGCVDTILGSGDFSDGVSQIISTSVMSDGSIKCHYSESGDRFQFSPSPSLSGDDLECVQFVCDYMNDHMAINSASLYYDINANNPVDTASSFVISTIGYSTLKEDAYNALNAYVASKVYNDILDENELTASALESALGESFPRYYFDITDPSKSKLSFKSPTTGNMASLRKDGFLYTPFTSFTPGQTGFTQEQLEFLTSYAGDFIAFDTGMDYLHTTFPENRLHSLYAFNYYFMTDDGSLYFSSFSGYYENGDMTRYSFTLSSATNSFYDVNGNLITGRNATEIRNHISSVGVVLNTGNQIASSIPVDVSTLTDGDFWSETGGEAVSSDIANSGIENVIGGAIGMGLIGADSPLTIGADGKIIAADGIPVDKLGQILEAIQSGNLNLDSIEDYLSLISTLVGNGNLTETEQKKILENVNANTRAGAKDLAQIRAAIEELTKEYEWEDEDEDTDEEVSWLTLEHTGMKEAEKLVGEVEMVKQSKQLLNNLLGKYEKVDSSAPKFSFYWDSDKDGITEKYTVLDLSFMEQTLTNANIDDKRRYRSSMTVRGFVRYLIVFLSYVSFAIKLLKRLPSLIGGVGEAADDIDTSFFSKKG